MSANVGADTSHCLSNDEEDNYLGKTMENSDMLNVTGDDDDDEGAIITTKSFYGLKHSSLPLYRTPNFKKNELKINADRKSHAKSCPRLQQKKALKAKTKPKPTKTDGNKRRTAQRMLHSILKPNQNSTIISCNSTPGKFFTQRSGLNRATTTVFSNYRIQVGAVLSPKNTNLTHLAQRNSSVSSKEYIDENEPKENAVKSDEPITKLSFPSTETVEQADILYSLFSGSNDLLPVKSRLHTSFRCENDEKSQMMIDVGQKNVESIVCRKCGMLYLPNSEEDSALHYKFHNEKSDTVSFNGWKVERVVREYVDGRVILILPTDPKYALNKVNEVLQVMDNSLGITDKSKKNNSMSTFLFVAGKKVVGCVMAEAISKAYRVVARKRLDEPLCCSTVSQRAVCGINRVWTATAYRRKKIATRLVDCVKSKFYYGCVVPDDEIAFTDPSPSGQKFAENYMKSEAFLVYRTV